MRIFESNAVLTGGMTRRMSKLVGPGKTKTVQEWVDFIGRNNTQLAMDCGVLSEVITEASLVEMNDVMKNGDYVVYVGDAGYVMYHQSDDKLWRTIADKIDELSPDNAEPVDGIAIEDNMGRIVMSGHETPPPADIPPGTPREIEPAADEFEDAEFDMELPPPEEELAPEPELEAPMEPAMAPPEPAMAPLESKASSREQIAKLISEDIQEGNGLISEMWGKPKMSDDQLAMLAASGSVQDVSSGSATKGQRLDPASGPTDARQGLEKEANQQQMLIDALLKDPQMNAGGPHDDPGWANRNNHQEIRRWVMKNWNDVHRDFHNLPADKIAEALLFIDDQYNPNYYAGRTVSGKSFVDHFGNKSRRDGG